jgi:hypothetical protein
MHVADSEIGLLSHLLLIYLDYFCQMRKPVYAFYIIALPCDSGLASSRFPLDRLLHNESCALTIHGLRYAVGLLAGIGPLVDSLIPSRPPIGAADQTQSTKLTVSLSDASFPNAMLCGTHDRWMSVDSYRKIQMSFLDGG